MPIHDWSRVDAGIYHGFHLAWIAELRKALNAGLLPPPFSADAEQYSDGKNADVLALHRSPAGSTAPLSSSGLVATLALTLPADTAERTARKAKPQAQIQRRVVVRHISGHRVVAHIEIVSPRNKDRRASAEEFIAKGREAIDAGIHLAVIDLFPATRATRRGLAPGVWRKYDRVPVVAPAGRPVCVASVRAANRPQGFFKFLAFGEEWPGFPLFLTDTLSVNLPLADTYAAAFAGSPSYLREELSAPAPTGA
jgi:hypothetical protein